MAADLITSAYARTSNASGKTPMSYRLVTDSA